MWTNQAMPIGFNRHYTLVMCGMLTLTHTLTLNPHEQVLLGRALLLALTRSCRCIDWQQGQI
jgi:hypothetical protein